MAFLYGLRLLVHALRGVVFGNVGRVVWLVRRGEFDRILARPMPPLLHVMAMRVPVSDFGNLLGGIGVFVAAHTLVGIDRSPLALLYLTLAVIDGCFLSAALQLGTAALAFRFTDTHALYVLINDLNNTFANYPLTIFDPAVRFMLTFALPLAFIPRGPPAFIGGYAKPLSLVGVPSGRAAQADRKLWSLTRLWMYCS